MPTLCLGNKEYILGFYHQIWSWVRILRLFCYCITSEFPAIFPLWFVCFVLFCFFVFLFVCLFVWPPIYGSPIKWLNSHPLSHVPCLKSWIIFLDPGRSSIHLHRGLCTHHKKSDFNGGMTRNNIHKCGTHTSNTVFIHTPCEIVTQWHTFGAFRRLLTLLRAPSKWLGERLKVWTVTTLQWQLALQ